MLVNDNSLFADTKRMSMEGYLYLIYSKVTNLECQLVNEKRLLTCDSYSSIGCLGPAMTFVAAAIPTIGKQLFKQFIH